MLRARQVSDEGEEMGDNDPEVVSAMELFFGDDAEQDSERPTIVAHPLQVAMIYSRHLQNSSIGQTLFPL
jgi:hypothetical protein